MKKQQSNWQDYARLAEHYKAVGQDEIYLTREDEAPWGLVKTIETGSLYRLTIPVSFDFRAFDLESGLTFLWSLDIEKQGANGSGTFKVDLARLNSVLGMLPKTASSKFAKLLAETAKAIRAKGDEFKEIAEGQYELAQQLERLG